MREFASYVYLTLIFVATGCAKKGLQLAERNTITAIPEIKIPYTRSKIKIDGKLDEVAWKTSAEIKLMINNGRRVGLEPARTTRVKLLWDEKSLYVAFICFDRDIHSSKFTQRDGKLWDVGYDEIEVAEMMLCVGEDTKHYFEFNFNPCGALLDAEVKWRNGQLIFDIAYNCNAQWKVSIEGSLNKSDDIDKYWIVEIALPISDIGISQLKAGQMIRANFYRSDNSEEIHFCAWSPTYKSYFHIPERFGRLKFVRENEL